ncbi:YqcI/YcgG family protein [Salmonella enterica]
MIINIDKNINEFISFIESKSFCCIGAKRANNQNNLFYTASDYPFKSIDSVYEFLEDFALNKTKGKQFYSSVVFFNEKQVSSERDFEFFLWDVLKQLNHIDKKKYQWANGYSNNTNDKNFSFSIAGEAFFVVGLHPMSHRISRRFNIPTLVFNHHPMFNELKSAGSFEKYKTAIRKNEMRIQGSINKYLSDFGDHSEACQYASSKSEQGLDNMIFNFGVKDD